MTRRKNLLATDPTAKMAAFTAAWQNLLTALGAPLVEPAYHLLDKLTAGISWLAKVVSEHPDAARITGEIAAGLSALSVALGAFAIGSAAIGALTGAAVGMTALGAALLPFAVGAAGAVALDSLITKLEKMVGGFAPASGGPQQGAKGVSPDWHETTKNRPGGPIIGDDDYRVQKEVICADRRQQRPDGPYDHLRSTRRPHDRQSGIGPAGARHVTAAGWHQPL